MLSPSPLQLTLLAAGVSASHIEQMTGCCKSSTVDHVFAVTKFYAKAISYRSYKTPPCQNARKSCGIQIPPGEQHDLDRQITPHWTHI